MGVLSQLEPKGVFGFFETICSIPHGSGNTDAIAEYIVSFAAERGFECSRDEANNVLVTVPASAGREGDETIILQAHTDMVCEKDEGVDFDFAKDALRLVVDGDTLRAEGTTLGADDGISVAMMLALADDAALSHPKLELLFTTDEEIGMLGGGEKRVLPITVSTYDSAVIYMEELGGRFALLICDECHHLPGAVYRTAAEQSIAPYRLGLSATPELDPDPERLMRLYELLGDIIYRVEVAELEGETLAPYTVKSVVLELTGKEKEEYECHRAVYRDFAVRNRIDFGKDSGWRDFLIAVSRRPDGRRAFLSYLRQRELSRRGAAKLAAVWRILCRHRDERILIFTADNAMAYEIGRTFCFPVITHSTKAVERKSWLDGFREGIYPVLVASRVLNEGVDVPEASIGIVVSGSGSVREHVQRLGRILRGRPGKQAILYELVNSGTAEVYAMKRRRGHSAYRGKTRS